MLTTVCNISKENGMLNVDYLDGEWGKLSTLVQYYQVTNTKDLEEIIVVVST